MSLTIVDGYLDEPSRLGVPPFVSPYSRYIYGAAKDAGHEAQYLTIDHWRGGQRPQGDLVIIIHGAQVPGKYLRTMPMSSKELKAITSELQGNCIIWSPTEKGDPDALVHDTLTSGKGAPRSGTVEDMANAVLFLASDAGRFISGVNLYIDGATGVDTLKVPLYE